VKKLHPKQIIKDIQSMGSNLTVEGDDLYIDNPMNIYPEIEQVVKDYKKWIVSYLKGEYSNQDHAIKQTIDKIFNFYLCIEQEMNDKIGKWLNEDEGTPIMVMELIKQFAKNGWFPPDPLANYESDETDTLSKELFERSMNYFRKRS
jgi:hypothetical protein